MSRPSQFIQSSDYLSVGADTWPTISVTIPNSLVIAPNAVWETEQIANVPSTFIGRAIRANASFSKNGDYFYGTTFLMIDSGVSPAGAQYYILVRIYRKSPSQVALNVSIWNQLYPATTLITSSSGGTITAEIRTLVIS